VAINCIGDVRGIWIFEIEVSRGHQEPFKEIGALGGVGVGPRYHFDIYRKEVELGSDNGKYLKFNIL
jgi:hypothetical protein